MVRILVCLVCTGAIVLAPVAPFGRGARLLSADVVEAGGSRLLMAAYYVWFDDSTWTYDKVSDMPTISYRSAERETIVRHVEMARDAGIDALMASWLGPGNPTEGNLSTLLQVASEQGAKAGAYFLADSPFYHSQNDVVSGLRHLIDHHVSQPSYVRWEGKPIIMFWRPVAVPRAPGQSALEAWRQIRAQLDPTRQMLWISEGDDFSLLEVFDGHHPYSIAWSADPARAVASYATKTRARAATLGQSRLFVATVMPGYNDLLTGRSDAFVRDRRDGDYYRASWAGAVATNPEMITITSFNEWVEGSQIEPSVTYGDTYLRLTRSLADEWKHGQSEQSDRQWFPETGFSVRNDHLGRFLDEFKRLGGIGVLGYPISEPFERDGLYYQAFQRAILQWWPAEGRARLANTLEWLSDVGKDDWLSSLGVPRPIVDDGSNGDFARAVRIRESWLTDPNLAAAYRHGGGVSVYGLPASLPERHGPFVCQRFQRIVLQLWIEQVPGMPAKGTVVPVLAGDLAKDAGLVPR